VDIGILHAVFETDFQLLDQANYEIRPCSTTGNYVAHELAKLDQSIGRTNILQNSFCNWQFSP
jgi:hypothetical protein